MADKKVTKNISIGHRVKHIDVWDLQLIKLAIVAFVLLVLKMWPSLMRWINDTNVWLLFAAFVIFAARPFYRVWIVD